MYIPPLMPTIGTKMVECGYATDIYMRAESNAHIALGL